MHTLGHRLIAALAAFSILVFIVPAASANEGQKRIVLTFDDLPYVAAGSRWTVSRAQRTTSGILDAIGKHEAPVVAFVNEGQLYEIGQIDERIALLRQWAAAGAVLGNHTFAHVSLNNVSSEAYKVEIVTGDVITRRLMSDREPYQLYFRHPYTHTGDTEEKKAEVESFLHDRGYKVAPHTVDSQDYIFNSIYVDSIENGDEAAARRLCEAYVNFVGQSTHFAEGIGVQLFGRAIPQTIILHANDINADCLDDLLRDLRERGYAFISLDEAMEDPAYQTVDTLVTRFGPSWLWRWTRSMDVEVSFRGDPEPPEWVMDAFRAR